MPRAASKTAGVNAKQFMLTRERQRRSAACSGVGFSTMSTRWWSASASSRAKAAIRSRGMLDSATRASGSNPAVASPGASRTARTTSAG